MKNKIILLILTLIITTTSTISLIYYWGKGYLDLPSLIIFSCGFALCFINEDDLDDNINKIENE